MSLDDLTELIASTLLPGGPELVMPAARDVAGAILAGHAVVQLPEASHLDEHGATWNSADGRELARESCGNVWSGDDLFDAVDAEEAGRALLAAARDARLWGAHR